MEFHRPFRIYLNLFWPLFLIALVITGCGRQKILPDYEPAWSEQDLRALQAPESEDSDQNIVAAYARLTPTDLEIRVDFLTVPDSTSGHLIVLLDNGSSGSSQTPWLQPAGIQWNLAVEYPAIGLPRAYNATGKPELVRPRILRLDVQDAVVIRLSRQELSQALPGDPATFRFAVFLLPSGVKLAASQIGPLQVAGKPPGLYAPLLLTFWDTLPAATPTQALRRWDGAHTGPYGQRHGLAVLLEASAKSNIPIWALDLKQPEKLAALEVLGGMTAVQKQQKAGQLILPDSLFGDPRAAAAALSYSQQAARLYQIPSSQYLYGALASASEGIMASSSLFPAHTSAFARLQDAAHLRQWNGLRLIPLPAPSEEEQVSQEGFTRSARIALLAAALSPDPADIVVLGGSLPSSPWGDSLIASPSFRYIAGHPWIHVLGAEELQRFPAQNGTPDCPDFLCLSTIDPTDTREETVRTALEDAPTGLFTDLAWQTYLSLTEPVPDPRLAALRSGYLGQVGVLLAASQWNASPGNIAACVDDLDWDGAPECVLATERFLLVIDPIGARLILAAARQGNQAVQVIGPRSQLVIGLGDPLDWRPEAGLSGDPQEIPGAFADAQDAWQLYQAEIQPGQITFFQPDTGKRKVYQIIEHGIQVTVESPTPETTSIPLLLLDGKTYQPGSYHRYAQRDAESKGWIWGLQGGVQIYLKARGAQLSPTTFTDGLSLLAKPEDPNAETPPGNFLPFPMALLELKSEGSYEVILTVEMPG